MNMMEFVKMFRKVDILESNQKFICDAIKRLSKNDKKIRRLLLWTSIDLMLVWLYNHMTDKEIKDLKKRVAVLEAAEDYRTCNYEAPDVDPDPEDMFEDATK